MAILTPTPPILRLQVSCAILLASIPLAFGQEREKRARGQSTEVATTETQGLNPALLQSSNLIASSNLLASSHSPGRKSFQDKWKVLFDVARQQRVQKDYAEAARNFTAIVEAKTPDEMKRAALIEL